MDHVARIIKQKADFLEAEIGFQEKHKSELMESLKDTDKKIKSMKRELYAYDEFLNDKHFNDYPESELKNNSGLSNLM